MGWILFCLKPLLLQRYLWKSSAVKSIFCCIRSSTSGYAHMCFRLFQWDNSEAYVDEVIYVDNCLSVSSWSYKSITRKKNGIFVQKHLIMGIYSVFTVFIFFVILCSVKCDLCVTLFTLWGLSVIAYLLTSTYPVGGIVGLAA